MPRNPNKRRCQTPGCNAYAMRSLPGGAQSKPGQSKLNASWTEAELFSPRPADQPLFQAELAQPIGPSWSKLNTSWRSSSSRSAGSSHIPSTIGAIRIICVNPRPISKFQFPNFQFAIRNSNSSFVPHPCLSRIPCHFALQFLAKAS